MLAFLTPFLGYAKLAGVALVVAALGFLYVRGEIRQTRADRLQLEVGAVTGERDQAVTANRSALQAVEDLKAGIARADAARAQAERAAALSHAELAKIKRSTNAVPVVASPVPARLGALIEQLQQRATSPGSRDADQGRAPVPAAKPAGTVPRRIIPGS